MFTYKYFLLLQPCFLAQINYKLVTIYHYRTLQNVLHANRHNTKMHVAYFFVNTCYCRYLTSLYTVRNKWQHVHRYSLLQPLPSLTSSSSTSSYHHHHHHYHHHHHHHQNHEHHHPFSFVFTNLQFLLFCILSSLFFCLPSCLRLRQWHHNSLLTLQSMAVLHTVLSIDSWLSQYYNLCQSSSFTQRQFYINSLGPAAAVAASSSSSFTTTSSSSSFSLLLTSVSECYHPKQTLPFTPSSHSRQCFRPFLLYFLPPPPRSPPSTQQ